VLPVRFPPHVTEKDSDIRKREDAMRLGCPHPFLPPRDIASVDVIAQRRWIHAKQPGEFAERYQRPAAKRRDY